MCLITVAPKGRIKKISDIEGFIREGMASNSDGSGFMWKKADSDVVNISKGYFNVEEIIKAIKKLRLTKSDELIIHHRTSTSGEVNAVNTHPFIVTNDEGILRQTEGSFNLPVMAHNGVFFEYSNYTSPFSDTYHFVQQFVGYPEINQIAKNSPDKFSKWFDKKLSTNRLAFLFPDRDLQMFGNFIEDDGYYHSNSGYKTFVYDRGGNSYGGGGIACGYGHGPAGKTNLILDDDSTDDDDNDLPKNHLVDTFNTTNSRVSSTPSGLIKFKGELIDIRSDNYEHFLVVSTADIDSRIKKNRGYEFEEFDETAEMNWLVAKTHGKAMCMLNWELHKDSFNIYVKRNNEVFYKGLKALVDAIGDKPSRSMLKKLNKTLSNKVGKTALTYKQYGWLRYLDLKHLVDFYSPEEDTKPYGEVLMIEEGNTPVITNSDLVL